MNKKKERKEKITRLLEVLILQSTYLVIYLNCRMIDPFWSFRGLYFACLMFLPVLDQTAWRPYRLSHITAFCINLRYLPKDQSLKFLRKNMKNSVILSRPFWFFCFIPMKINLAFISDIVYFCTSDGSFRILKKRGPQTFIPAV